ncbi:hypothetical protein [Mycolicibacterium thermoresistibile]
MVSDSGSTTSGAGGSDAERIAAAEAYIDALVSHRADAVPFAPDCTRVENGLKTGFSGKHLRRSLTRGPQFRVIEAATDRQFTVVGDEVRARFTIVTRPRFGGRRVVAHVDETFVIPDGTIHHIRARIRPGLQRG